MQAIPTDTPTSFSSMAHLHSMQGTRVSRRDAEATIVASEKLMHAVRAEVSSGLQLSRDMINDANLHELEVWREVVVAEIHELEASVLATVIDRDEKSGLFSRTLVAHLQT